jgi:serine/threonine-protein kinase
LEALAETGAPPAAGGLEARTRVLPEGIAPPTFGRYEIVRELGQGAMGRVFLGRDPRINREVAIKTLACTDVPPAEQEEIKERFFQEAEAAGSLPWEQRLPPHTCPSPTKENFHDSIDP